jgi:chitinase
MDDFLPECSNVKFPLLRSINSEFKAASNDKKGADKMPPAEVIYHFDINKKGEKI